MTLPALPDVFYWTEETWGAGLRCRPLDAIAPHLFTTRQLALSHGDGYRRLAESIGAREVARANQVHGNTVLAVRRGLSRGDQSADADVLISDDPAVAVAVRAADCVPLLLADAATGAVAAVHAGWRGTAARAAAAAVDAMVREFGSRPADLTVAIGPSIGGCCYEVGPELVDAFAAAGHARHLIQRWFATPPPPRGSRDRPTLRLDVSGANRDQLVLAGVPETSIHMSGLCTAMHLDVLTSYRAEKEKAERIAGAIRARS